MKSKVLLIAIALLVLFLPVNATIYTEVECKERNWFWWDYTCHEHEVQEAFDEVTGYINANEEAWLKDTSGISIENVITYLETTFWNRIIDLIDNKLDEREALNNLGWRASAFEIGLETARIKAQRLQSFETFEQYTCDPEGMCLALTINA